MDPIPLIAQNRLHTGAMLDAAADQRPRPADRRPGAGLDTCARAAASSMQGRFCRLEPLDPATARRRAARGRRRRPRRSQLDVPPLRSLRDLRAYAGWVASRRRGRPALLRDRRSATRQAVGVASLSPHRPGDGSIEVGHLNFSPRLQRTPAATEAMFLMMRRAFDSRLPPLRMEVRRAERAVARGGAAPRLLVRGDLPPGARDTRAATATPRGSRSSTRVAGAASRLRALARPGELRRDAAGSDDRLARSGRSAPDERAGRSPAAALDRLARDLRRRHAHGGLRSRLLLEVASHPRHSSPGMRRTTSACSTSSARSRRRRCCSRSPPRSLRGLRGAARSDSRSSRRCSRSSRWRPSFSISSAPTGALRPRTSAPATFPPHWRAGPRGTGFAPRSPSRHSRRRSSRGIEETGSTSAKSSRGIERRSTRWSNARRMSVRSGQLRGPAAIPSSSRSVIARCAADRPVRPPSPGRCRSRGRCASSRADPPATHRRPAPSARSAATAGLRSRFARRSSPVSSTSLAARWMRRPRCRRRCTSGRQERLPWLVLGDSLPRHDGLPPQA